MEDGSAGRRFVVKAVQYDGSVSWLGKPDQHGIRSLRARESAASFAIKEEAQAELNSAANIYARHGIALAVEPAEGFVVKAGSKLLNPRWLDADEFGLPCDFGQREKAIVFATRELAETEAKLWAAILEPAIAVTVEPANHDGSD